mgnify:FL=1
MTQSSKKPTVQDIQDFYENILNSLMLTVDKDGLISMDLEGNKFPSTINDKRMVLPTHDVLRAAPWETQIAFHPLSENVYRGESPVLKKLKALVNFRLTTVITILMTELVSIAANKDYHEKLTPKQSELLDYIPKANDKTVDAYVKVLNASSSRGKHRLINIYLKHGGKYKNEDYSRVAVTSFPITEEFDNDDKSIFGVKLPSQKDFKGFQALFDFILPNNRDLEAYSYGSRSMEAPYFDALMHAYVKVAKQLNKVTWLFRKHLENHEALMIDHKWEDALKDLSFFRGLIPGLQGNDGELSIDEQEKAKLEEEAKAHAPAEEQESIFHKPSARQAPPQQAATGSSFDKLAGTVAQAPPWEPEPAPEKAPEPQQSSGNGLSWDEVMARKQQAQQAPQQAAMQQPWQQPPVPQGPPPGFAGTNYSPQQPGGHFPQSQPVPPGGYANHPRTQMQQPQPQHAWQQQYPQQQPQQPMQQSQQPGSVFGTII